MASQSLGFRSAGVHQLDLGLEIIQPLAPAKKRSSSLSPSSSLPSSTGHEHELHGGQTAAAEPPKDRRLNWNERKHREQQELKEQRGASGVLWPPQKQLSADNIGYGLLRKAGWNEGSGLGAKEQVCALAYMPRCDREKTV